MKVTLYREKQLLSFLPVSVQDTTGSFTRLSPGHHTTTTIHDTATTVVLKLLVFKKNITLKEADNGNPLMVFFNLDLLRSFLFLLIFIAGLIALPLFLAFNDIKAFAFSTIILLLAVKVIFDSITLK